MNCFPCFQNKEDDDEEENQKAIPIAQPKDFTPPTNSPVKNRNQDPLEDSRNAAELEDSTVKCFTFREMATATKNFRQECLLGEGGFGKVFKGTLQGSGQTVAVRQLERNTQGNNFVFEISTLSLLRHQNLVKMVGYCADGEQRLLAYEYLPSGSLKSHLFDIPDGQKPLDWTERMKIACGIADGLEYLHEKADEPVIYRDLRSSNVLLTETKQPKLADYGLAKIVQGGNMMHMSVMTGFNGYCAPEFEKNGELTVKSDVYSFGVVLLELITGRKALDTSLPVDEQNLVSWATPLFKDPSKFPDMADPRLRKGFSVTGLNQAVGVAAMCIQEEPIARPLISDISAALSFLAMAPPQAPIPDLTPMLSRVSTSRQAGDDANANAAHQHYDNTSSDSEEEEDDRNKHEQHHDCSSEEYTDNSYDSEEEEEEEMMRRGTSQNESDAGKARCKSTKSVKLASSSKRTSVKKKKSMRIQSRSDSRSNNKKSTRIQSRSDSRNTNNKTDSISNEKKSTKVQTPPHSRRNRSSCSSLGSDCPLPVQQHHDRGDDYSSSSDDDDYRGSGSPQNHQTINSSDHCPSRSSSDDEN